MTMRALLVEAVGGEDNEQRSLGAQLGAQRSRGAPVLQPDALGHPMNWPLLSMKTLTLKEGVMS